jgi:2-C-methyl-D-erythritol 4-phosphate cytidylyltransferase
MKRVDPHGRVLDTPSRAELWHAHTPQVFPAELVRRAYEGASSGTDDAALVESVGGDIQMVDAGSTNIKVTRPEDIPIAESILAARSDHG